jgi:tRNA pseudouridine55 synthase
VNGLLVIDKPGGLTSHDVVSRLRRITGEKSIGHLGTLDPMATGVLPLLLGKYTRLAQYFSTAVKSYTGAIRFGYSTDTYDAEGVATSQIVPLKLGLAELRALGERFLGVQDQLPPPYSAKKINGQPAYKLAREGKPVELKTARVEVFSFELLALEGNVASFAMSISSGGYVRSVAHELGQLAGCGAHLSALRRTQAGVFLLDQTITLETLDPLTGNLEALEALTLHPREMLPEMPSVTADLQALNRLRNGAQANLPEFSRAPLVKVFASQRELVAVAKRIAGTLFQPVVVMN